MRTHFIKPAIPAAASPCPMLLLELVSMMGIVRFAMRLRIAPTSMGSPSDVPVPWHSAMETSSIVKPPSFMDAKMHCCWDGPCGAVRDALRPSWFTQAPTSIPQEVVASKGSEVFRSSMPPMPSPRAKPSADSLNVKHRPMDVNIPGPLKLTYDPTPIKVFVPIAMFSVTPVVMFSVFCLRSSCLLRKADFAMPVATSEEEQAVSAVKAGPLRPIICDKRVHVMEFVFPE
mmetsp:Transcript_41963/g.96326  ORF Transcript_41963/g.96326 Transcript_41963/m.96326 type:complete len:230 (+) Transcript_41963:283-972(+)